MIQIFLFIRKTAWSATLASEDTCEAGEYSVEIENIDEYDTPLNNKGSATIVVVITSQAIPSVE